MTGVQPRAYPTAAPNEELGRDFEASSPARETLVSLAEALDRLLECGVVVDGNATIGVAGVELIHLDLRLLLASFDTAFPEGPPARSGSPRRPIPRDGPPLSSAIDVRPRFTSKRAPRARLEAVDGPNDVRQEELPKGLLRLVLTLVGLLHELLEKQALRRVEKGVLSDAEIDALGRGLLAQAQEIETLRRLFGLEGEDLALRLGAGAFEPATTEERGVT
ncbi:hypothetical protein FM996_21165 [Methylosinus sporium]|uniref:Gas vesicle protein K n=1 Tax=Methylosinus sporium TaxID=428 RepID=A0A549SCR9_METSR|nr:MULTISPECIES: gas vesicle protein GvpJ [Methylosinus]TRL22633.1 hypothetical protein FM996_21165 [Methylosinus sporium]BBU63948.1 hypothetical protein MSC49_38830 [Methylosinus sp. C49]